MNQKTSSDGNLPGAGTGSRSRSGRTPTALLVIYLIILAWAALAWIRCG
ncbi:MAG: hypothetical protein P4L36_19970 [Holophaga sp.]|nr:hypothetical protein [Holophaga sp.]